MIGPDHYRRAEELLLNTSVVLDDGQEIANVLAAAQVHATLALAAATALGIEPTPEGLELWDDMVMHPLDVVEDDDDEDTGRLDPDADRPCAVCGVVLGEHDDRIPSHEWIGGPR